ncbi:MAG TPA: hypothetical protein VHY08_18420 [Bacillota bacterium]|nr:hypothetical protein [Bacillota bacterium]
MAKSPSKSKSIKIKKTDLDIQGCDCNHCPARKTYFSECYLAPQADRPCTVTIKQRG